MSAKSVTLDEAVKAYFTDLEMEKLAAGTLAQKKRVLARLQEVVGRTNRATRKLTDEDFRNTLTALANGDTEEQAAARRAKGLPPRTGRRPASLQVDRTTLTQFVSFLKKHKWVRADFDPLYRLTSSTRDQGNVAPEKIRQRRSVPGEDWPRLLEAAGRRHALSRIIVAVGLYFGTRSSETVHIRFRDLNLTGDKPTVHLFNIKRGRPTDQRGKPIPAPMVEEIRRWVAWLEERYGPVQPDWFLVPARLHTSELTDHTNIQEWPVDPTRKNRGPIVTIDIQASLVAFGWSRDTLLGEGGHTLRRSHLIEIEERASAEAAQAAADHSTLATTQRYTGNKRGRRELERVIREWDGPAPAEAAKVPAQASAPAVEAVAPVVDLFSRRQIA